MAGAVKDRSQFGFLYRAGDGRLCEEGSQLFRYTFRLTHFVRRQMAEAGQYDAPCMGQNAAQRIQHRRQVSCAFGVSLQKHLGVDRSECFQRPRHLRHIVEVNVN
jgi:hypothetical protein